jgi:pimeloyl-ACP methyl ester carboxylesterase
MPNQSDESGDWIHHFAVVNGVRLHYVEAGADEAGRRPLVVLLHGFPEFWYSWRQQIAALAAAGYRVIAPDLRGYNQSDKPRGVASYRLKLLIEDVVGLIRQAGQTRARIVGHDWGGGIAWWLAIQRPDVVEQLAILNAPHPAAFFRELRRPGQLLRSWYMFFFQLPWLPEMMLRAGDFAGLARTLRKEPVRPGTFSAEDIRLYKEALRQPGALTAGINYYRAALRDFGEISEQLGVVSAPTLLIWGLRDRYLGPRLLEGLEPWVPGLRIERLDASHWVQNDAPEEVNRLLVEFFGGGESFQGGSAPAAKTSVE